jgi:hypothetical protein
MREVSISSAESDDNGAYISKGNAKRFFQYNADGSRTVHQENGTFYANVKTSKGYRRDYTYPILKFSSLQDCTEQVNGTRHSHEQLQL